MPRDRGGLKAGTWIALHDGMPDHPKIEDLSDRAFRALVTLWCWCGRHLTDGAVTAKVWRKHTTPSVRRELVTAGLVDTCDDGSVEMHDYLDWQRSAREVSEVAATKRRAGLLGNHKRWHVEKGVVDPGCEWCAVEPPPEQQNGSHVRPQNGSHVRPQPGEEAAGISPESGLKSDQNPTATSPEKTGASAPPEPAMTSENTTNGTSHMRSHLVRREEKRREEEKKNLSSAEPPREDIDQLCAHLADRVAANTGRRPTITGRWRDSARLLLDKDLAREPDPLGLALRLADWATNDEFWRTNVLSMPTFRAKFDQLRLKARRQWEQQHTGRTTRTTDDKRAAVPDLVAQVLGTNGATALRPDLRAITGGAQP